MTFLNFITTFVLSLILFSNAYAKEIAISFDDAPRRLIGHFTATERAKELIKQLKLADVKDATFYCVSSQITEENKEVLKLYTNAGFTIASHTHTHPDFNKLSFKDYSADFLTSDKTLSQYPNYTKYFRYPYLREGNETDKRNKMRNLLKAKGYHNAYITVDFSDWHLEHLYRQSLDKKEKVNLEKLKALYISLAKESLEHYDKLAIKHIGRSPKHVLLLHETDIAALFIKDLVMAMRSWGWKIISSKEAYTDDISKFQLKKAISYNPGRVGEIAMEKGHDPKDIWADSTAPKYITKRYNKEVIGTSRITHL